MATATLPPDPLLGLAVKWADAFEEVQVEALTPEQVSAAILACRFLRDLFAMARRSIEASLGAGVDAQAFAAQYEPTVTDLDTLVRTVDRVVAAARTSLPPTRSEEFVSQHHSLGAEIAGLRQFLLEALAKAKTPVRPMDWKRAQESEAAYTRGETKPFQRSTTKRAGD
jgi:hypothetical protein